MQRNSEKRNAESADNGFEKWGGYMAAKRAKLRDQFSEVANKEGYQVSNIFKGISIYVNGHTDPTSLDLKFFMAAHGGIFQTYQSKSTTHIIASCLPYSKIIKLGSVPVVRAAWIVDSIAQGELQDYRNYLLYPNRNTNPFTVNSSAKTASNPTFLQEFYNNSRLHLIATMSTQFKQLVNEMRADDNWRFTGLSTLPYRNDRSMVLSNTDRIIMHIDMDCFFVSVGIRNRPELKGKPVAVTHARNARIKNPHNRNFEYNLPDEDASNLDADSSMSEIASCSYEARRKGIRNGMFLGAAIKLCPDLVTIPYDFEAYKVVAEVLYKTVASYTLDIEALSCDELYADITKVLETYEIDVLSFASLLREQVMSRTGCPCSAGFGRNRLQARLATKRAKPCGQFYFETEYDLQEYLNELPIAELPGIGPATVEKLTALNVTTCSSLRTVDINHLRSALGQKTAQQIMDMAKGADNKPLNCEYARKSVSAEINYGIRFQEKNEFDSFLLQLSEEVTRRLREVQMKAKSITLKIMSRSEDAPLETAKYLGHGQCDSISKSATFDRPVDSHTVIYDRAKHLFESKMNIPLADLRGVGIQLTKLVKDCARDNKGALQKLLAAKSQPKMPTIFVAQVASTSFCKQNVMVQSECIQQEAAENCSNKSQAAEETIKDQQPPIFQEILNEFMTMSWNEDLKPMFHEWINTPSLPLEIDVELIGDFLKQLASDKRSIELLRCLCNFIHRNITHAPCCWHIVYRKVTKSMQEGIHIQFGASLNIPKLQCSKCNTE